MKFDSQEIGLETEEMTKELTEMKLAGTEINILS